MTKISVIIPTYNDSKDIRKCLRSLKKQTLKWGKDFEVIVVDGHSTDGTDEIAKEMGAKVVYEDIGTRGGACNVGAEYAKSDIIVFTDADAYFPSDWIEKILKKFRETGADVVGGDDILGKDANDFERLMFSFDIFRGNPKNEREVINRLRGVDTAYKKRVFESVGGFNPKLASVEETEMHWRMHKMGYKMVFDPDIFVYHHRRRDMKGLIKQMIRNGIGRIVAIRHRPEMISLMDILPFTGLAAVIVAAIASVVYGSIWPVVGIFVLAMTYFLLKAFLVSLKSKNLRRYHEILALTLARELSFAYGLFIGVIKSKKPSKKM